jgi:hypothetical protein
MPPGPPPPGQPGGYGGGGGGWGGGYGGGFSGGPMGMRGMRRQHPIETKPFLLTSEFGLLALALIGLFITTIADNSVDSRAFWTYATVLLSAYMLSRGIAKSGTKSRSWDPREDPDLLRRGQSGSQGGGEQ